MSLKQTITDDMKTAMKARDMETLTVLRSLLSEIKNAEIESGSRDSDQDDDAMVEAVVKKMAKQVNESIIEYTKGGREDLVAEEQAKLVVLEKYLPQQMSDEDLRVIVKKVVAESGQTNIGPVTGMVMKEVAGQADGNRVSAMVKEELAA